MRKTWLTKNRNRWQTCLEETKMSVCKNLSSQDIIGQQLDKRESMNKDVPKYGLELYKINKYKRIWK